MNTDPYQPCEKIYQQTRKALELLAHRGFSACILTKSDLVSRDVELLKRMPGSSVGFSIAFQDEAVRQIFEPKAPPNEKRINTMKKLKKAGIETYTLITPVMPFITNVNKLIEKVASYADTIWIYGLSMESKKDKNWENIKDILNQRFPDLVEKYQEIAFSSSHPYWVEIRLKLEKLQRQRNLNLEIKV